MKALVLLFVVLGSAIAVPYLSFTKPHSIVPRKQEHFGRVGKADLDLCPTCVSFSSQFIDQLLNIILNAGVVGGCGEICSALAKEVGNQLVGEVCDILCSVAGVEEFVKFIEKADIDPIYYCELLKFCPINDNGDATIMKVQIDPASGPQGEFSITMVYKSNNGTGTGEVGVEILTVDGLPLSDFQLNQVQPAGTYTVTWNVKAEPDPDCDPTQGPCEMWLPGVYNVTAVICNGECGSAHPNSKIYSKGSGSFTITGQ